MTDAKSPTPLRWTPTRIRALRGFHAWSQMDLSFRLGVHYLTIQRWEQGTTTPSPACRRLLDQLAAHPED